MSAHYSATHSHAAHVSLHQSRGFHPLQTVTRTSSVAHTVPVCSSPEGVHSRFPHRRPAALLGGIACASSILMRTCVSTPLSSRQLSTTTWVFNACGGGTGSGLECLLLKRLSVDCRKSQSSVSPYGFVPMSQRQSLSRTVLARSLCLSTQTSL